MKKNITMILVLSLVFSFAYAASAMAYDINSRNATGNGLTDRVWGEDRIQTAIDLIDYMDYYSSIYGDRVFICTSENWPDALSIGSLAHGPILLTPSDELDSRVEDAIEDFSDYIGGDVDVTIVGETGAISEDVEEALEDMDDVDDVERIGGKDRYETCAKVAEKCDELGAGVDGFFVCSGENWPDALAASAISNNWGFGTQYPILLVKKDSIPSPILDFVLAHKDTSWNYVIGGTGAISSDVMEDFGYFVNNDIERVWGDNRYETCIAMVEHGDLWDMPADDGSSGSFLFATGSNWPDALTGTWACGEWDMPVILTGSLDESVTDYFDELFENGASYSWGLIMGGKGAVDKETEDDIAEALSDGDFEPTTEEPTINSFDITVNDGGGIDDIPDVAQYDPAESVEFDVETDEKIYNEDDSLGKVVIEDISELGGDVEPYNEADFELTNHDYGDASSDNGFSDTMDVKKKSTSPEQREVTFVARAENQAGSDTMESDSVEIYN